MREPEPFTKIPNALLDDVTLTVYERAILIHIARQTIGYGKKSDGISIAQFAKATNMSNSTAAKTLNDLEKKKRVKVKRQTSANGGKSYNRYSLPLIRETGNHIRETDNPYPPDGKPLIRETDIQKKIVQKKIDKRGETEIIPDDNIFFSLSGNEQARELNRFLNDTSADSRNPTGYKVKLRKQIAKGHDATLAAFEEWYLGYHCEKLTNKHRGKAFGEEIIEGVHSYLDTKGFEGEHKFIVQTHDSSGGIATYIYATLEEVEGALGV